MVQISSILFTIFLCHIAIQCTSGEIDWSIETANFNQSRILKWTNEELIFKYQLYNLTTQKEEKIFQVYTLTGEKKQKCILQTPAEDDPRFHSDELILVGTSYVATISMSIRNRTSPTLDVYFVNLDDCSSNYVEILVDGYYLAVPGENNTINVIANAPKLCKARICRLSINAELDMQNNITYQATDFEHQLFYPIRMVPIDSQNPSEGYYYLTDSEIMKLAANLSLVGKPVSLGTQKFDEMSFSRQTNQYKRMIVCGSTCGTLGSLTQPANYFETVNNTCQIFNSSLDSIKKLDWLDKQSTHIEDLLAIKDDGYIVLIRNSNRGYKLRMIDSKELFGLEFVIEEDSIYPYRMYDRWFDEEKSEFCYFLSVTKPDKRFKVVCTEISRQAHDRAMLIKLIFAQGSI